MDGTYGIDCTAYPDLDPFMSPVDGPRAVAEALWRRLQTPRGSLPFEPDAGIDLREWLHAGIDRTALARMKAAVEAECLADGRVESVSCGLDADPYAGTCRVTVEAVLAAGGGFTLVGSVSDFDFTLIGVQ